MLGNLGDIAKAAGSLDMSKATDTVNELWDDRDNLLKPVIRRGSSHRCQHLGIR